MSVSIDQLKKLQSQETYEELGITPKWKPNGRAGKNMLYVCYHDARDVQSVLDTVCGIGNWQNEPRNIDGKLYMGIGINVESEGWIWKFDVGTEKYPSDKLNKTQQDAMRIKGEASDAMKRAGYNWGIFRGDYEIGEILLAIGSDGKTPLTASGKPLYTPEQVSAYCNGLSLGAGYLRRVYYMHQPDFDANPEIKAALDKVGMFVSQLKQ